MALIAIAIAVLGLVENLLGVDALLRPAVDVAATHPLTALCIIVVSIGLIRHRSHRPQSRWVVATAVFIMTSLAATLGIRAVMFFGASGTTKDVGALGAVGSDTAIILLLMYAAVLVRRRNWRLGLTLAISTLSFMTVAFIALSYGKPLFGGQMAVTTLLALLPVSLAILTIFAHRSVVRVVLLSGPVGLRTRLTLIVGFVVPWLGGWIVHQVMGVPQRAIPIEAIVTGVTIHAMAIVAITSGLYHEKVDRSRRVMSLELKRLAIVDTLTNTLNRTGISAELASRWDHFRETGQQQCVILLDLDHSKQINDTFGHETGDKTLTAVGKLLAPHLRKSDTIGRWGGEEFLILLEVSDQFDAEAMAERLRNAVAAVPAYLAERPDGTQTLPRRVTASFGVAMFSHDDDSQTEAIRRADKALYRAKETGRNRVILDLASGNRAA